MTASVHNVNEIAELEKRLAELQAETDEPDNEAQNTGSSSASFDDIFAPAKPPDRKRPPRVQGKNDPRDSVRNFKVGDLYWDSSWKDAHLDRQLIPYPQYPNPGQPFASYEEEYRYEDEDNLWRTGRLTLEGCIYRAAWKHSGSLYYREPSDDAQREDMIWMNGVLAGRGLPLIDDAQLLAWAKSPKQYAKMEDRCPYQIPEPEQR